MANLSKIVKISWSNYQILKNGGTVSGQTYDANAIYLIEEMNIIDISDGITSNIKEYVKENQQTMLLYNNYIYVPQYFEATDNIPTYYSSLEANANAMRYIMIDWNNLVIDDSSVLNIMVNDLTKGRIWYGNNNNHAASLPIGSERQVLKVIGGFPAWANEYSYTLPLAASGTRGGIQTGYSATGANIPLQLSSEKAYVALTSSAIVNALGYTPANKQDVETYYLPLAGGVMTGGLVLSNGIALQAKNSGGTALNLLYINTNNTIKFGNTSLSVISVMNKITPNATDSYNLGESTLQWNRVYGKTLYENGTSLAVKYLGISATAADSSKLNGQLPAYYLNYNNLTNKPTIPATNVIPATTTANKMLVSTTTSGTAKWSDWSSAGFLKTNASGVISVDTNSYALSSHVHNFADINNRFDSLIYFSSNAPALNGYISPVGMSLSLARSACRTDFIHGDAIVVECSDDGSTWTTVSYSKTEKSSIFTTNMGLDLYNGLSGNATLNSKCRITLTAQTGTVRYLYTNPRKMLINYSSPHAGQVLIEKRNGTNYLSDGAWVTIGTYNINGWSGWNEIPLVMDTLGGLETQTGNWWQLRLTFSYRSLNSSYLSYRTAARNILIFGDNNWGGASAISGHGPISATGHLYSYDMNANATFPAMVGATTFTENGTSLSNKYLGLNSLAVGLKSHTPSRTSSDINTMHNGFNLYFIDSTNKAISPSNNDGLLAEWSWPGNTNYGVQFFVDESVDDSIYFRQEYTSGTWRSWIHMASREWVNNQSFATKTYVDDAIAAAITTALNSSY